MASLYELTGQYRILMDMMRDTDVDDQAIADTMEAVGGEIEIKADNYMKLITSLEADEEALMKEADRLASKAAIIKNRKNRLKVALQQAMQATGKHRIQTELFTASIVSNGGDRPLVIDGEVPQEYKKITITNDNAKIRWYLEKLAEAGLSCVWAHLGDRGTHLRIK